MLRLQNSMLTEKQLKEKVDTRLKEGDIAEAQTRMAFEAFLNEFECNIAMLDKITDGIDDDPITAQALSGLHTSFCSLYHQLKDSF